MKANLTIITSIFVLFSVLGFTTPTSQNDRQRSSLKGPVKLVYKRSSIIFTFEHIDATQFLYDSASYLMYNVNGDLDVSNIFFSGKFNYSEKNSRGKIALQDSREYDSGGNIAKRTVVNVKQDSKTESIYKIDNGNITSIEIIQNDDFIKSFDLEYNSLGLLIKKREYNSKAELNNYYTFHYNESNILIEEKYWNSYENDTAKTEYVYDSQGNNIEIKFYNDPMSGDYSSFLKYDEGGNLIELKYGAEREEYKYNKEGNIILESFWYNGYFNSSKSFKYTYDQYGNWTKKTEYVDEIPVYQTERTIQYYD